MVMWGLRLPVHTNYGFMRNVPCGMVRIYIAIVQNTPLANTAYDPLSSVLELLRPHGCVAAGLDAGGNWSIRYAPHSGLKCNAVLKGACWLTVDGRGERVWLQAGDCVMLPHGKGFLLAARDARLGDAAETIHSAPSHGETAVLGAGGAFFMAGARFLLSGLAADLLMGALPDVIVIRGGAENRSASSEAVEWAITRIASELRQHRPGSAHAIEHLSHVLLVELMRCHLEDGEEGHFGWTAALADPFIGRACAAMHGNLAFPWTVGTLAACAGLSRTAFAVRFARIVGRTPMDYLTQWRMLWAAKRLDRAGATIAEVAAEVGYASESAFTVAFKRTLGKTPRRFVRDIAEAGPDEIV